MHTQFKMIEKQNHMQVMTKKSSHVFGNRPGENFFIIHSHA